VRAGDLQISLKLDKSRFFVGEPMVAWVVIENRSDIYVRVNLADLLAVNDSRGVPVEHVGPLVMPRTGHEGSVLVAPRSERVERFEPATEYGLKSAGEFTLEGNIGATHSERVHVSLTRIDTKAGKFLDCLAEEFDACVTRTPGSLPSFQTDPHFAPYVAIAKLRSQRRVGEPKDLIAWKRDFEKRFPSFDQPSYLFEQVANLLSEANDPDQLSKLLNEESALRGHPMLLYVREQAERSRELAKQAKEAESKRPAVP
jgi:hypothetical protein